MNNAGSRLTGGTAATVEAAAVGNGAAGSIQAGESVRLNAKAKPF